jgi:hypothetical protein
MVSTRAKVAGTTGALLLLVAALGPLHVAAPEPARIELASASDGGLLDACAIGIGEGGAGAWAWTTSHACAEVAMDSRLVPSPAGLEAARAWTAGLVRGGEGDASPQAAAIVASGLRALLVGGEPPADAVAAYAEGVARGLSRAGAHPSGSEILRALVTLPREADLSALVAQGERDALGATAGLYAASWT